MCFKFCDSFAGLFRLLDERLDGDVRRIGPEETDRVLSSCFQCKLCEVQCPYTPRDGHAFQLDFPKLVHRAVAVRARERGLTLRERFLGDPDRSGRLARASLGLANRMNRFAPQRALMEKALGIDRRKLLPGFAPESFEAWARKAGRSFEPGGEAVLFQTCFVQHNEPALGRDALAVLDAAGVDVRLGAGLVAAACRPGSTEISRAARARPPGPGRAGAARREGRQGPGGQPDLLDDAAPGVAAPARGRGAGQGGDGRRERDGPLRAPVGHPRRAARRAGVQERARDGGLPRALPPAGPGHRVQGRDLMRRIPGTEIKATVMECCGHNGTFAMKVEGFEASARLGKKAFEAMKESGAEVWATECPLAALQFEQHAGKRPLHPLTVLARALAQDGFPKRASILT
jgi:Fe-S oxidoreductase